MKVQFIAAFAPGKRSLQIDLNEGNSSMGLIMDAQQLAQTVKLVLFKGKTFTVTIEDAEHGGPRR